MPIVIDEVIISVDVPNAPAASGAAAATAAAAPGAWPVQDKQALIAECVERVLDVLAQRREP